MASYPQRTDLAVSTPKSKTYGDATASRQAQQQVPMGNPSPVAPAPVARPRQPLIPLDAPSQYPDEPITAGANFGPGPNARAAGIPIAPQTGSVRELLIYLNSQYPNSDIENLLSTLMDD